MTGGRVEIDLPVYRVTGALVSRAELARMLDLTRKTVWEWECNGLIPERACIRSGRNTQFSVPRLIEAGWLKERLVDAIKDQGAMS